MKEFLLVFRRDAAKRMTDEQLQQMMQPWKDWLDHLAAQGNLASSGSRLDWDGSVIYPDEVVTNGPYVETKEAIGGFSVVNATDLQHATELAKSCPILKVGGSVEVRPVKGPGL